MKTYSFDPVEFAKLTLVLTQAFHFLHRERSKAELDEFQARFYPILYDAAFLVLYPKMGDDQRAAISESYPDPWDEALPADQAVEILAKIFDGQISN